MFAEQVNQRISTKQVDQRMIAVRYIGVHVYHLQRLVREQLHDDQLPRRPVCHKVRVRCHGDQILQERFVGDDPFCGNNGLIC